MIAYKGAVVERVSGKQVVLSLDNGQTLTLLRDELEPNVAVGMEYRIQISPQAEAVLEQQNLARILLNQLLENVDQTSATTAND